VRGSVGIFCSDKWPGAAVTAPAVAQQEGTL
jgi:hypothetical protein